jgi:hypothetical protein
MTSDMDALPLNFAFQVPPLDSAQTFSVVPASISALLFRHQNPAKQAWLRSLNDDKLMIRYDKIRFEISVSPI